MTFNPGLNLAAFSAPSPNSAPPALNAIYLRDGKYDGMSRADVAETFKAFREQNPAKRLALFFHGGLVDKASGQQGAANEYDAYSDLVFPLFFIWESGIWELLAHHLPLVFAETIFGRVVQHAIDLVSGKVQTGAAGGPSALAASLNASRPALKNIQVTSADIDAFMLAVIQTVKS